MSRIDQLMVEVDCRLAVSDRTAIVCMKLLEEYINQHPDKDIVGHYDEDGRTTFELHDRSAPCREEDQTP